MIIQIERPVNKEKKRITKKRRKRRGKDSELILDTYLTAALEGNKKKELF